MRIRNLNLTMTICAIGSLSMISCEDPNESRAENEFNEYRDYVEAESGAFDNSDDWEWDEYDNNWREYDSAYQEHATGVEENLEYLSEENKAEYDRMQGEYENRRSMYEQRSAEEDNNIDENSISGRMYVAVDIVDPNPDNVEFSKVTAENLRETYKNFVDYIESNKGEMTDEDWENAEIIWEALNLRKNEVEKDIPTEDNVAIGTLKVEYGALKSSYGLTDNLNDSTDRGNLGERTDEMEKRNQNPKN